jgi:hypothetical protein
MRERFAEGEPHLMGVAFARSACARRHDRGRHGCFRSSALYALDLDLHAPREARSGNCANLSRLHVRERVGGASEFFPRGHVRQGGGDFGAVGSSRDQAAIVARATMGSSPSVIMVSCVM